MTIVLISDAVRDAEQRKGSAVDSNAHQKQTTSSKHLSKRSVRCFDRCSGGESRR